MTATPVADCAVLARSAVVRSRFVSSFEKVDLPAPLGPHTKADIWALGSELIELVISEIALFHSGGENSSCMMLLLGASSEVHSWTCQHAFSCRVSAWLTIRNVSLAALFISSELLSFSCHIRWYSGDKAERQDSGLSALSLCSSTRVFSDARMTGKA